VFLQNRIMSLQTFLRRVRPAWAALILLAILTILVVCLGLRWELAGSPPPEGLPRGLAEQRLRELAAAGTKIRSLKGLPSTLHVLDVSYTDIDSLASVPQDLRTLDIRQTRIEHLVGFPPYLETLKIGNRKIFRLGNLPGSLRELHLVNTGVRDLTGVPPHLRTLYVKGKSLESLDGLPGTLQSLTLDGTSVKSLKNLPPALQTLELIANRDLQFQADDLPPLLTRLVIDHEQRSPDVSSLKYLTWFSDRRQNPNLSFPKFLSSLTLRLSEVPDSTELRGLPRSLRALGLLNASLSFHGNLPQELEVLDLTGYSKPEVESLRKLSGLRRLELGYSSVSKLPELPASLQALVLTRTKITNLRDLPRGLKTLIFCESDLKHLDGKDLPASLAQLDLCNSRSLQEVSSLPRGLTYLNLGGTGISRLPQLVEPLQELDVSNTKIKNLDLHRLPKSLTTLTLNEGQINNLEGLPASFKTLRLVRWMDIP
jgi:outer membrane protein YopM